MTFVLVRVIQTIVVTIADINSGNAIAVIARKQIAETRSTLGLTVTRWLVASVQTVIVPIAVPSSRNTSVMDICAFCKDITML